MAALLLIGGGVIDARPATETLEELQRAVQTDPDDLEARRQLGLALQRHGRKTEAVVHFEAVAGADGSARSVFELARAYSAVSRLDDAERLYLKLLEDTPNHPGVLHNLGTIAVRREDFTGAIDYFRRAIEADSDYMLAYRHLGDVLERMGAIEQAYAVYLTILEMKPSSPTDQRIYHDSVERAAGAALELGNAQQAEQMLAQLIRVDPNHAAARYTHARALMLLGREQEAKRELEVHARLLAERAPDSAAASGE